MPCSTMDCCVMAGVFWPGLFPSSASGAPAMCCAYSIKRPMSLNSASEGCGTGSGMMLSRISLPRQSSVTHFPGETCISPFFILAPLPRKPPPALARVPASSSWLSAASMTSLIGPSNSQYTGLFSFAARSRPCDVFTSEARRETKDLVRVMSDGGQIWLTVVVPVQVEVKELFQEFVRGVSVNRRRVGALALVHTIAVDESGLVWVVGAIAEFLEDFY